MSEPYVHEIRVAWGDCDPARIVYTARIPWFALDAINGWWEDRLGDGWFQMELDRGVGTPFVNMNLDFRSPITPRHRLMCSVQPVRLGETSITFEVVGRQDGVVCFEGRFTCVFVTAAAFAKCPPPEDIRALVEAHLPVAGT
ncbi:acyl-CoA thioesterase [Sagittula sp. S175]|uniref:acyl-CoA thioesterase n=1 Tax=Sagittula sp. S175 TaxID=3415129 RepID=UPI003C7AA191